MQTYVTCYVTKVVWNRLRYERFVIDFVSVLTINLGPITTNVLTSKGVGWRSVCIVDSDKYRHSDESIGWKVFAS